MTSAVTIKGNKYGIRVILSPLGNYEEIKEEVALKFKEMENFFGNGKMAISFEGRLLTDRQQEELIGIIHENCNVNIVCIMENDPVQEERFRRGVTQAMTEFDASTGQFHKGHLRSGQVLEVDKSIIIIGDVNPGASVVSKGNIIVLGALKGTAFAGASGNPNCFVVALSMKPMQIRIADSIARSPDKPSGKENHEPKIAFSEEGNIYIEPLTKSVLNDIKL